MISDKCEFGVLYSDFDLASQAVLRNKASWCI